jgi:hypothetical protein
MVSPESTRPSLSRDICIVEISILCLSLCKDVCRNTGEIIKFQEVFLNEGGGQTLGVEYQLEFSFCFLLLSHHSVVIVIVISLCKCISFMCVTK